MAQKVAHGTEDEGEIKFDVRRTQHRKRTLRSMEARATAQRQEPLHKAKSDCMANNILIVRFHDMS